MNLKEIRKSIDLLDARILKLLNDRMELALMTKRFKTRIEESEREREVLDRIRRNASSLIDPGFVEKIYQEIIKESKNLQKKDFKLSAFQGEHGAYGEVASSEWDSRLVPVPCREFSEIFDGVSSGLYSYGLVPVENRVDGVVGQVNQLLIQTDLYVVGAVELPIHFCLLVLPGTDHREIRTVHSHFHTLAQCRRFLDRNRLEPVPYYDTAGAAKMLAEEAPKASAAVASRLAAELYNLEVIKEDIEDHDGYVTRFLILSREENEEQGDKCSIIFSTEHKAGTLFRVLEIFAKAGINLTRIESMPHDPEGYVFFLDFIGSKEDEKIAGALREVEKLTAKYKFMGCYREKRVA